ncbi:MAG TPA: hypothetical protein VEV43_06380 [Actinomycetota bacterium]|nr:hypothetical protein [Actinomycetota bacterium]
MTDYYFESKDVGEEGRTRAFSALLDVLGDQLVWAHVDGYTDYRELPTEVELAFERLKAVALDQYLERWRGPLLNRLFARLGDPLMAVRLDLAIEKHREILRVYGPYSIHAEVYRKGDKNSVITIHDCDGIGFDADVQIAAQVEALAGLPPGSVREVRPGS